MQEARKRWPHDIVCKSNNDNDMFSKHTNASRTFEIRTYLRKIMYFQNFYSIYHQNKTQIYCSVFRKKEHKFATISHS
jgi:hypothetical protein